MHEYYVSTRISFGNINYLYLSFKILSKFKNQVYISLNICI